MPNLNLHGIVRGAIQQVNEDRAGIVYLSQGTVNVGGILTPQFSSVPARLQTQAQKHSPNRHDRGLTYSNNYFTVYAFGNFSGVDRSSGSGGDMLQYQDDASWYSITQILELWPDWCCFEITKQLNAASISALLSAISTGAPI